MKTSKYLLVLSLWFVSSFLYAQNVQVNAVNFNLTTAPFYSCNAVPFKVTITNTGATQATDVKFTLHSADITLTPDDFVLSITPASQTNYYYDAPSGVFWLSEPLLAGQALTVIIPVKINCSIFSQSPVPPNVNLDFTASVAGVDNLMNTNVGVITGSSCSISAGADKSICPGTTTQLNVTAGAIYSWTPSNSLSNPNIANPVATVNATTTYTVIVTNVNGCINVDQVKITALPRFYINGGYDHVTCPGYTLTFNAGPAVSYSWSPTTGLSDPHAPNPSLTATTSINYTLTATNAAGCEGTDEVTVTILPPTFVNAGPDQTICEGTPVTLNATGAPANTWSPVYTWSPAEGLSDPESANPVVSPTVTTTYTVTSGYTPGYCSSTDQVTITVKPKPTINAGADITICAGTTRLLTATGATNYTWTGTDIFTQPGSARAQVRPLVTTTYTVTTKGTNGCNGSDDVTVIINPLPVVNAGPDQTVCGVPSLVQLNGTVTGAASFKWISSQTLTNANTTNPSFTANYVSWSSVNTYYFTLSATNADGCSTTDQVSITSSRTPEFIVDQDKTICLGTTTIVHIYQNAPMDFWNSNELISAEWTPSATLTGPKGFGIYATPTETTTYSVTAKNRYGCTATKQVKITVDPTPTTINAGADQIICEGKSAQLNATGSTSYAWTPADGLSNTNIPNPVASPLETTLYTVSGPGGGCAIDQVLVTVKPKPSVNAGVDQTICYGSSTTLEASGAVSYSWAPAAGLSNLTSANPTLTNPVSGTTYVVTGTDEWNCTNTDRVIVSVRPKVLVNAGSDKGFCSGSSGVQLSVSAIDIQRCEWTPVLGLSDYTSRTPTATPTDPSTTYTATITNSYGCTGSDAVIVYRKEMPIVDAGIDRIACGNGNITLTATTSIPGGSMIWTNGSQTLSAGSLSASVTPTAPRIYTFRQTITYNIPGGSNVNCTASDNMQLSMIPDPWIYNTNQNFQIGTGILPPGVIISDVKWYWSIDLNNVNSTLYAGCSATSTSCTINNYQWRSWRAKIIYSLNGVNICEKYTPWRYIPGTSTGGGSDNPFEFKMSFSPSEEFVIYPIPADNSITVELNSATATIAEIIINDMLGAEVLNVKASGNKSDVYLEALPSGIYILGLKDSNGELHVKRIEVKK